MKCILKTQQLRAPDVKDIFTVFHEYSDERRHLDFVAGSFVQYNLCKMSGSGAGNVERDFEKYVLGSQAENSSYVKAYVLQLEISEQSGHAVDRSCHTPLLYFCLLHYSDVK